VIDSVKAAMIEVHLLVVNPTQQQRETTKVHAAAARKSFLFRGLLHDCLNAISVDVEDDLSLINVMVTHERRV